MVEMGQDWAEMRRSFDGRSIIDLMKRWLDHTRSRAVHDGTKFTYTVSYPNFPESHGKRCEKRKMCRKETTMALVEEEVGPETTEAPHVSSTPAGGADSRLSKSNGARKPFMRSS
jgi:hypothetical protein